MLDKGNCTKCDVLAIERAKRYSPNSVDKDAAVLEGVCRILESEGLKVCTVSEDEMQNDGYNRYKDHVIYASMGRHSETLRFLSQKKQEGAVVVNSPEGVNICCNRKQLNERLKSAGVPLPPEEGEEGYWLKRACGVAESSGDVRFAATREEMTALKQKMAEQGIGDVVVQAHVTGDLIKFYGVARQNFFRIYYPGDDGQWKFDDERRNGMPQHYAFDIEKLHEAAEKAAETTGVDVYGGDCIVTADGNFAIIDFNDWPSFSRCRNEAVTAIATHIINIYREKKMADGPKGYIFDYGGTLDTGGMHWGKALWHAYERCGVPVTEQMFRDAYVYAERTLGKNRIIMPDFTFRRTLDTKLQIEMEYIAEHQPGFAVDDWHGKVLDDIYTRTCGFTAESVKRLKELKKNPDVHMVLVSNFYGNVETVLKEMGFDGLFDSVIESAVVGIRKPDPRIFELGVEALGLKPEECVVIGDSYDKDIVPAKTIGCKTVWIKGEGWTNDDIDGTSADKVVTELSV